VNRRGGKRRARIDRVTIRSQQVNAPAANPTNDIGFRTDAEHDWQAAD
jgi:hypothetical protein